MYVFHGCNVHLVTFTGYFCLDDWQGISQLPLSFFTLSESIANTKSLLDDTLWYAWLNRLWESKSDMVCQSVESVSEVNKAYSEILILVNKVLL